MKVTFFRKFSKFYVDIQNAIKLGEDVDGFEGNCVWTCCRSFCQLREEYMSLVVKVLRKSPKISDTTQRHDTELNLFDINRTLAKNCCRLDFSSVLDPWPGWFPNGVRKQEFYGIQVTTFFGINNFGDIKAMKLIFY